jgi:hypothetical protein
MSRRIPSALLLLFLAGWLGSAESPAPAGDMAPMMIQPLAEFVSPDDSLSRLRMLDDGLVTLNDRCPVRLVQLNRKMGASYVNGRPVGFC